MAYGWISCRWIGSEFILEMKSKQYREPTPVRSSIHSWPYPSPPSVSPHPPHVRVFEISDTSTLDRPGLLLYVRSVACKIHTNSRTPNSSVDIATTPLVDGVSMGSLRPKQSGCTYFSDFPAHIDDVSTANTPALYHLLPLSAICFNSFLSARPPAARPPARPSPF